MNDRTRFTALRLQLEDLCKIILKKKKANMFHVSLC